MPIGIVALVVDFPPVATRACDDAFSLLLLARGHLFSHISNELQFHARRIALKNWSHWTYRRYEYLVLRQSLA